MADLHAVGSVGPVEASSVSYGLALVSLGYETRARHVVENLRPNATRKIAWKFPERQELAYRDNHKYLEKQGYECVDVPTDQAEAWMDELVDAVEPSIPHTRHVCVDVSSSTRERMAVVVAALHRTKRPVVADFLYSISMWHAPSRDPEPIVTAGPVLPLFAGWSRRPEERTVAIVGLGYEPDKAVGAYEYLEANGIWTFLPYGTDNRFDRAIHEANGTLLKRVPAEHKVRYRVDQPVSCFGKLHAVAQGVQANGRPVLLPFGPKIFSLCALLVACSLRDVPVWRISPGQVPPPEDRLASGRIVGIRAYFGSSDAE